MLTSSSSSAHRLGAELHLVAAQRAHGRLDGRERRAQLVRDGAQQRRLERVGRAQGLGLDIGVREPLALLRERQHARQRARDALGDLVLRRRAGSAPISSSRPITRPSTSSGSATWPASGPRPSTMRAAGAPIAAAATRAASTWASSRLAPPTSALERPASSAASRSRS